MTGQENGDFIKELYLSLVENGWTISQIDEMDILFYFKLLSYQKNKSDAPDAYIDELF